MHDAVSPERALGGAPWYANPSATSDADTIAGALLAALVAAAGADTRLAVISGVGGGIAAMLAFSALTMRTFGDMATSIDPRCAAPAADQDPGRRNT